MDCLRMAHDTYIATLSQRRGRCKVFGTVGVAVVKVFQAFHSFHAHGLGDPQCGIVLVSAWAFQSVQTLCRSAARHHVGATGRQDPAILCFNVWVHGPARRATRCLPKPPTAEDSTLGLFEGKFTTR